MFFDLLKRHIALNYLLIIIISCLLFIPFLGSVHLFDWDEINFAESAREMIVTGNYTRVQINFQPFWEKPPLFFWLQAMSMKLFGINEFAARFPNAICGIATLSLLFYVGNRFYNFSFALQWVLIFIGSFLPHFYFKSGIIDPWFNLFIFLSIFFGFQFFITHKKWFSFLSGIFSGLAILTKGPVGLLIVLLTFLVFSFFKKDFSFIKPFNVLLFVLGVFIFSSLWFGFELWQHGTWFITEFIEYHIRLFNTKDSGHGGPFFYHFIVLLLGCFPASIIAIRQFNIKANSNVNQHLFKSMMLILFCAVLILFSIVKTKIVHYSSMCYLPLTFMAALGLQQSFFNKIERYTLLFFGIIIGFVFAIVPILGNHINLLEPFIRDPFGKANIQVAVVWPWWLCLFGLGYIAASIFIFIKNKTASIFYVTTILIFVAMVFFVPRIERYSQGSAIDFYKTLKGNNVAVEVSGFKSYAQYFYSNKMPCNPPCLDKEKMLYGKMNIDVYIVTKINKAEQFQQEHLDFIKIKEAGGFVFFLKPVK